MRYVVCGQLSWKLHSNALLLADRYNATVEMMVTVQVNKTKYDWCLGGFMRCQVYKLENVDRLQNVVSAGLGIRYVYCGMTGASSEYSQRAERSRLVGNPRLGTRGCRAGSLPCFPRARAAPPPASHDLWYTVWTVVC